MRILSSKLRSDCTVNNPCGRNGYCRNNKQGEWKCVCRFWWTGPVCDKSKSTASTRETGYDTFVRILVTSSGTQVIVLGVFLFVLIVTYYGLQTYFRKRMKRKTPSIKKEKFVDDVDGDALDPISLSRPEKTPNLPRKRTYTDSLKSSPKCHALKIAIVISTLLLTVASLISKWAIIQTIHDDIVDKFNNSEPLFFERHPICQVIDKRDDFNVITFPAACLLTVIFALITKRVSFKRGKGCNGYIGVPIPYDFFGHKKRTFAAVVFAIFADELLEITNQIFNPTRSEEDEGL
jgi:hypothetical protein